MSFMLLRGSIYERGGKMNAASFMKQLTRCWRTSNITSSHSPSIQSSKEKWENKQKFHLDFLGETASPLQLHLWLFSPWAPFTAVSRISFEIANCRTITLIYCKTQFSHRLNESSSSPQKLFFFVISLLWAEESFYGRKTSNAIMGISLIIYGI